MSASRQTGDQAYRKGDFFAAIAHYTTALERPAPDEDLSLETKRAILSQRVQASIRAGAYYDAALDCDRALSPAYTTDQADRRLTGTLYLHRAYVRQILTYYEDAWNDFVRFEQTLADLGEHVQPSDSVVLAKIEKGLNSLEDSEELNRVKLIRAVQARGMLLSPNYRHSFPRDPDAYSDNDGGAETCFEHGAPGVDYLKEPISVLFDFSAPYLNPPYGAPNRVKTVLSEDAIIGDNVHGIFTFVSLRAVGDERDHEWYDLVLQHESREACKLLLLTRRGRVLSIPWNTKVGDIWDGARLPREGPSSFEELWSPPASAHGVDGMELLHGCLIPVYVVPNAMVSDYLERLKKFCTDAAERRRARFRSV